MKKQAGFLGIITALSLLCGCTAIPDKAIESSSSSSDEAQTSIPESTTLRPDYYEIEPTEYTSYEQDFRVILSAEGGVYDGALSNVGEFNGTGFIRMQMGNTLTHILNVNTTQHYRIVLAVRSDEGAAVSLEIGGELCGTYYVPKYEQTEENPEYKFEYISIEHIYLNAGQNILKFTVDEGSADIDFIIAENSGKVPSKYYDVTSGCAGNYASVHTVNVMRYLSEIYGISTLTAQNVSPATNAEIEAVYNATGRYPAIRSSELAYALLTDNDSVERLKKETELALEWTKKGGLQVYTWHWFSPNYTRGTEIGCVNMEDLFRNQTPENAAMLGQAELEALVANNFISAELATMISDLDKLAAVFKLFDEQGQTILFAPLPDGDIGKYWWGESPESYKTLWKFVFERLSNYHKLKSLIWVWNGSDMAYFPEEGVDIIGQSFYESADCSFAGRFSALAETCSVSRPMAIVACDVMPNIDYMVRDNAKWLWVAPESGSYTLNVSGALSEEYNSVKKMKNFYNHKNTIALDELPDFDVLF